MEFIENIKSLSFKDVNTYITGFSEEELFYNEELFVLINKLKEDHRKNVIKLGISLENKRKRYLEEVSRVREMYELDRRYGNDSLIAGVDEVGRGPLAGPMVAAAVILKNEDLTSSNLILGLTDSKN